MRNESLKMLLSTPSSVSQVSAACKCNLDWLAQPFFVRNNDFCSDIHYETHLELKYLKVSVQTLIWVCVGSKMQ